MIGSLLKTVNRLTAVEGPLAFILLFTVVGTMVFAVLDVGWVPEDRFIIPITFLSLIISTTLARRQMRTLTAWSFITLFGFLIVTISFARLWPPLRLLFSDWSGLRYFWLDNGALFLERIGSWFSAVSVGGRTNETIVFALIMGFLAWFLTAYVVWSAYRLRRPLLGLTLMGLVIAFNGYYGAATLEYAVGFVGVAVLATAVLHFANLEKMWQKNHVDYSREIRLEMVAYAAAIGMALLALSYLIPSISPSKIALLILGQPGVVQLEENLDRAFGGVQEARGKSIAPGQSGGTGIMPRSFLLGGKPELEKITMMTATAQVLNDPEDQRIQLGRHWRGLSYEKYTGRGWSLGEENLQKIFAAEQIALVPAESTLILDQDIHWRYDNRATRYSLGLPTSFDHETILAWRDPGDLVRVKADLVNQYKATSRISSAAGDELRSAALTAVPRQIINRYTQLPGGIPQRVHDLALTVTGDQPTPYDQALALERFLRQYDYSLEVELPPQGADPVDYFLFDLQKGYCDYYASAMVVMARSLGLPARLATGFLAQPPDEFGVQTIRQIDSHSWAEIFFAGYGWIEFEPTAPFISPHDPQLAAAVSKANTYQESAYPEGTTPIPQRAPRPPIPWARIGLLALLLLIVISAGVWWIRRPKIDNKIAWTYYQLQQNAAHLGHPFPPSRTPNESSQDLLQHLETYNTRPRLAKLTASIKAPIQQLTHLFNTQQYSAAAESDPQTAVTLWKRIRRPLWLLRLARLIKL